MDIREGEEWKLSGLKAEKADGAGRTRSRLPQNSVDVQLFADERRQFAASDRRFPCY